MRVPRIIAAFYAAVAGAVGAVLIGQSYRLVFARGTLVGDDLPGLGISLLTFIVGIVLLVAGIWGVVCAILAARSSTAPQ